MKDEHEYSWLNDVREALLADDLVDPPAWLRQRATVLFDQARRRRARLRVMERVRASLLFNSRRSGLAHAGVRSSVVQESPWQLLYRGGEVDVDLLVRPNQDGRTLTVRGQALSLAGSSLDEGVVEALPADLPRRLHGAAQPTARSPLEATGEFALPNLQRGRYDVLLRFGSREIELTDLELY